MTAEVFNLENFFVGALLLIAVILDIRFKKIRNPIAVGMLVFTLVIQISLNGASSVGMALASFMTAFLICLPLFILRVFGGGDFKLLLAISPLLYWKSIVVIVAAALVWGALLGIFRALLHGQGQSLLGNLYGLLTKSRPHTSQLHMIPFTVAFFFGFMSWITLSQVGWKIL
jgi:Flp pilus assembly protein protease CpaA